MNQAQYIREALGEAKDDPEKGTEILKILRDIVKHKQAQKVNFADGSKQIVDMFSASAVVAAFDKMSPANQKKDR